MLEVLTVSVQVVAGGLLERWVDGMRRRLAVALGLLGNVLLRACMFQPLEELLLPLADSSAPVALFIFGVNN